jgi:hypothetical protein
MLNSMKHTRETIILWTAAFGAAVAAFAFAIAVINLLLHHGAGSS